MEGSPWLDKRVRHAANLCVNRTELKELLGRLMAEATGTYEPGHPWHGNPSFQIKYDPAAAKKLMQEAGHSASKPLKVKVQTSAFGSGQMMPIPHERVHAAGAEGVFCTSSSTSSSGIRSSPIGSGARRTLRPAVLTP